IHGDRTVVKFFGARRPQTAVVPREFDRRHITPRREVEVNERSHRVCFVVTIRRAGFDAGWRFEFEDSEEGVKTVATHIAKSAAAEISPAAPRKGKIDVIVRTLGRWTQPEIPVEPFGNGIIYPGALNALRPEGTRGPIVDFADGTNGAGPNPFAEKARVFGGLIADGDLCGHAGFTRDFRDATGLVNRMSERLLAKDVFALAHSCS